VVQSQAQSETKTEAVPSTATKELTIELTTPIEKLPSEMIFKDASFVYKEANDKSQKTWWFKKGTLVLIVGSQGDWIEVRDAEKRKGFVNKNVLANKQPQ
jgi:SH3-like domain-containing protein